MSIVEDRWHIDVNGRHLCEELNGEGGESSSAIGSCALKVIPRSAAEVEFDHLLAWRPCQRCLERDRQLRELKIQREAV